jgi:hypothetical protein
MRTNLPTWSSTLTAARRHPVALILAALAVTGVGAGAAVSALDDPVPAPAAQSQPAPTAPNAPTTSSPAARAASPSSSPAAVAPAARPEQASVDHAFELQPNYYYCGPAATRVALSAHRKLFSEDQLATMLGTTTAGTASSFDITRVLNEQLGPDRYRTVEIPGQTATPEQVSRLKADIVSTVSRGDAIVANVIGDVRDASGNLHSFPGGHYLSVVGYLDRGDTVRIADSAGDAGGPHNQLNTVDLANWIASRGYSA